MDDYADYINQEVAALKRYKDFKRVKRDRFSIGCPYCGLMCERMGGGEGSCDNCSYCGTDGKDQFNQNEADCSQRYQDT